MARVSDGLLLFLANAAWQVAFVGLLAAAIDRLLRAATARYRHLLWVAALMVAVTLPVATTWRLQPAAATQKLQVASASAASGFPVIEREARSPVEHRESAPARGFEIPTLALSRTTAATICALYGLLLLFRLGSLTAAWRRTRGILRQASEVEAPPSIAIALARC